MNCKVCGKPLTDLNSILMGMGPVCGGRYSISKKKKSAKEQGELMFDNHAVFAVCDETDDFVYIQDRGRQLNCKTITNNVSWVLSELDDLIENFESKRLFYMDSDGRIDEIVHNGKYFVQFKAGHEGVTL